MTHVSYSELNTFRDCPLKWYAKYVLRLDPPERSARLDLGTAWHRILQVWYDSLRTGADEEEARAAVAAAAAIIADEPGTTDERLDTLRWMFRGYVDLYGLDPDFIILDTEEEFEFPMPVDGDPELMMVGRIDLRTRRKSTGKTGIWDHKSASQRDLSKDGFINEMLLEDQFGLYNAAKRLLGEECDYVVYSATRTDRLKRDMTNLERFVRVSIPYQQAALDTIWEDSRRAAAALVRCREDPNLVYSVPNPKQCGWKCDFQRPHIESRATGRPLLDVALGYGFTIRPEKGEAAEVVPEEAPAW